MQSCVHCHCLLQSFVGDKEPCYLEGGWTLARFREWNFLLCLGVSGKISGKHLQSAFRRLFAASCTLCWLASDKQCRRPIQQQGKYFTETNTFNNRAAITKAVKFQFDCKQQWRVLVDFSCSACLWVVPQNPLITSLISLSSWILLLQHIFGHHPYTNIDGFDPDISTAQHVSIIMYSEFFWH